MRRPTGRGARPKRVLGCVLLACLVLPAAAVSAAPHETAATRAPTAAAPDAQCNPLRADACAMPYPSDTWSVPDPESPTGLRLSVGNEIMDAGFLAQLPPAVHPAAIFEGRTGFSAAGPVLFEVDRPIAATAVPADGGDIVAVWDLTSRTRVDVHAERDHQALDNPLPAHVVRVWPVTRFEYGHRYLAVLTRALAPRDGPAYEPSPGVSAALSGTGDLGTRFAPTVRKMRRLGVEPADVLSFTTFTVRTRAEVEAPLRTAIEATSQAPHPVRIDATLPGFLLGVGAIVLGEVQLTDFRTDHDGHFSPDRTMPGEQFWSKFILLLPASPRALPAPVVVYGHGITATKETGLAFGILNAGAGWATLMFDQPNHGPRAQHDGGDISDLPHPANAARLVAIPAQSAVDVVSIIRALQTSLADLDVLPFRFRPGLRLGTGDARPDLDTDHIIYEGTSMGAVLGTVPLTVAPDIDAGLLQVGGVGIMHTLVNSLVWDAIGFDKVLPNGGTGADTAVAIAAIQFLIDHGDGVNYADSWDEPWDGGPPRPVLHIYGQGDAVVPNHATERLALLTGTPLLKPVRYPIPGLEVADGPQGGSGLLQIRQVPGPLAGLLGHLTFIDPDAVALQRVWLRDALDGSWRDT
ncbi:MAG: hypothetical protein IT198_11185 [Acidimicrobiia bacterium]|nr:hypothetical protein [Acidimicrobiia bacterium]